MGVDEREPGLRRSRREQGRSATQQYGRDGDLDPIDLAAGEHRAEQLAPAEEPDLAVSGLLPERPYALDGVVSDDRDGRVVLRTQRAGEDEYAGVWSLGGRAHV
ncbi:MAG TPA: hypothetical protein VKI23_03895 [Cellulomonadaceae bacterium]|nr:hypothetical protein [Cellulomonadaceae bacterium]